MSTALNTELRQLVRIAVPVVVVQVGQMLMGVVDTVMVGHLSGHALAAAALGNMYTFSLVYIAMGTLMALDPLVAQAVGARDDVGVTRSIQRGLILAVVLTVPVVLAMLPAVPLLRTFKQPESIVPDAAAFVHISTLAILPLMIFIVFRQSLQAIAKLAPIVWTTVIANLVNAGLNWVLIFGNLGAPQLGVRGSAMSTAISRWLMMAMLLGLAWRDLKPHLTKIDPASLELRPLLRMLGIGIPIGLQQVLEVGAFVGVGLLMGRFGATQVGAHQIALNLAALTFMVPLGVAAAASVRVGNAVGAGDLPRAHLAARLSYAIGAAFMSTTAVLFLTVPEPLARLYTNDTAVIEIAALLIPIGGVFQVFDGMQCVGAGVLRGLGDTRVPLISMTIGYWLLGVPVSLWLGFYTDLGPVGLWWGFVVGLVSVAGFLVLRVRSLFRRGVGRVAVDQVAAH